MPLNYEWLRYGWENFFFLYTFSFWRLHSFCFSGDRVGVAVTFTWKILSFSLSPLCRKSDWHRSASRSPGRSMKNNIWGTTGKEKANSQGVGVLPPGTSPIIPVPATLTFMGSSVERQALRRINNAAAGRANKREHPMFWECKDARIKTERICKIEWEKERK